MPILEDYEFVQRLRLRGRIAIAPAIAVTSGRRWRELGAVRTTLLNQAILFGFRLGVPPARLASWYRARRTSVPVSGPPFDPKTFRRSVSGGPSSHDHT